MSLKEKISEVTFSNEVGNTKMVKIANLLKNSSSNIYAKCEYLNPSGSHKDRTFNYIIEQLEKRGEISPGMTLVDCSTGNGGGALARCGKLKGYKIIVFMPEGMTEERISQIKSFDAEIIETPREKFLNGSVEAAGEYARTHENCYFLDQASNPLNREAWDNCGKEIVKSFDFLGQKVDYFICAIGTGGTFSGIAKQLKIYYPDIITVGIEVDKSAPLFSKRHNKEFKHKHHNMMGLGAGVLSSNTDENLVDIIETVSGEDSWTMMKKVIQDENLKIGPTSGANILMSLKYAKEYGSKNIVTVLFDSAWKYYSRWDGVYPEYQNLNL